MEAIRPQSASLTANGDSGAARVGAPDAATGKRPPVYVTEQAPWSAVRNAAHSYGFASFDLDPGRQPGDMTTIKVTYYDVLGTGGQLSAFETFTLRRPRRDGPARD